MDNILKIILLILIILTPAVLWTLTLRRCFKRSMPFSIIISIVLAWIAMGIAGGLMARTDKIILICSAVIIYIFYVAIPVILLIRNKKDTENKKIV